MNIRQAILRAADQIETRPDLFNFDVFRIPNSDCHSPGCALGWIGYFLGLSRSLEFVSSLIGCERSTMFYERMTRLDNNNLWKDSASECAACLRLYADKYHPAIDAIPGQ